MRRVLTDSIATSQEVGADIAPLAAVAGIAGSVEAKGIPAVRLGLRAHHVQAVASAAATRETDLALAVIVAAALERGNIQHEADRDALGDGAVGTLGRTLLVSAAQASIGGGTSIVTTVHMGPIASIFSRKPSVGMNAAALSTRPTGVVATGVVTAGVVTAMATPTEASLPGTTGSTSAAGRATIPDLMSPTTSHHAPSTSAQHMTIGTGRSSMGRSPGSSATGDGLPTGRFTASIATLRDCIAATLGPFPRSSTTGSPIHTIGKLELAFAASAAQE